MAKRESRASKEARVDDGSLDDSSREEEDVEEEVIAADSRLKDGLGGQPQAIPLPSP